MLRSQRRIFTHRVLNGQITQTKNIPQNTQSIFDIQNLYPTHRPEGSKAVQARKGLRELSFNTNINDSKESCLIQFLGSSKINASATGKGKENLFIKIAELIKNEECPVPLGFINQHKLFRKGKERPYSSLSHRGKHKNDQISLNRVSAVLHITKNEDQKLPEMTSTSRALMNFSKVYKNPSSDRFKVKKDKSLLNKFVHLDAQKIVFQQKQKRQPKQSRRASIDRAITFKNRKRSESTRERYQVEQEEQFQLGGWDYNE